MGFAVMFFLDAEFDKIIKNGARNQRFKSITNVNIGRRLARVRIDNNTNRMLGPSHHLIINVGSKDQNLTSTGAMNRHFHSHERRIVNFDGELLDRGYEIIDVVVISAQHGREQLDHSLSVDRRALIIPRAVTRDTNLNFATIIWIPCMHRRSFATFQVTHDLNRVGSAVVAFGPSAVRLALVSRSHKRYLDGEYEAGFHLRI